MTFNVSFARSATREQNECSINMLNDDILGKIFNYLQLDDKIRLRRTCLRWKYLLNHQLSRLKALRIGQFHQGGFSITSGLHIQCSEHHTIFHRQQTGTLFNDKLVTFPADLQTHCFSITHYDYLHRSLKFSHKTITQLSLGRLNISYRLLRAMISNLPNLEHLELIACASRLTEGSKTSTGASNDKSDMQLPSVESFNAPTHQSSDRNTIYSIISLYNQNPNEQVNVEERLLRSTKVRSCDLVLESKEGKNCWPNLRHLLVKDCNLMDEFSLSLILAITNQTLVYLVVESNQYLTGEFLNYCGPKLKILRLKYCPMLQLKFLEELVKLKQLLSSPHDSLSSPFYSTAQNSNKSHQSPSLAQPQPLSSSTFQNYKNLSNKDIYCTL